MGRKKIWIPIAIAAVLIFGFMLYSQMRSKEYVTPNYENVYSESITKYTNPFSLEAHFGEAYFVTITGDKTNGYTATLSNEVAQ